MPRQQTTKRALLARTRPTATGCRRWTGAHNSDGYGVVRVGRALQLAHRAMWEAATGQPIPKGRVVCHACDVRDCCNYAHLWLGTAQQNIADAARKGRLRPGGRALARVA